MVTADLISRAQAGDGDAFRQLTEPHRRELQVHCYRMLGSFQDAEDAVQDTLLAAWQSFGGFEGRASLRTWLYRIATTRCLNARRSASRRPAKEWDVPKVTIPVVHRAGRTRLERLWTGNKALLIQQYLHLFVIVAKHGTYVDGFAGPQYPTMPTRYPCNRGCRWIAFGSTGPLGSAHLPAAA